MAGVAADVSVDEQNKNNDSKSETSALAKELEEKVTTTTNADGGGKKKEETSWADVSSDEEEEGDAENTKKKKEEEKDGVVDGDVEEERSGIDSGDRTADVHVLQADPSTPYYSAATFEELELGDALLRGVYANKFNKPSKIQATSLPMILSKDASGNYKNLIGQAHNGSGKTACFVLGMLSRIDDQMRAVQALCVVPTRELARQIKEVIATLGKFTNVSVYLAVPQTEEDRKNWRERSSAAGGGGGGGRGSNVVDQIVVGTPGKIWELIKKRSIDPRHIRVFVLDEADEMVDAQAMGDQTLRINRALPKVQTLLFSATYADEVRRLAEKLAPDANQITVKRKELSLKSIKQYYFDCTKDGHDGRFNVLSDIYGYLTIGQSIIFVRTRRDAADLTARMRAEGHTVGLLYGGQMTPEERDRVIDEFRGGTTKVLITTNVLARGLDILQVTVVINYDLPTDQNDHHADAPTYMHRIGRTGRFGNKGVAINFVHDQHSRMVLKELEEYYDHKATEVTNVEDLERRIKEL